MLCHDGSFDVRVKMDKDKKDFHAKISLYHILLSYKFIYISHLSKRIYIFICIHTYMHLYIYILDIYIYIYTRYINIYIYCYICIHIIYIHSQAWLCIKRIQKFVKQTLCFLFFCHCATHTHTGFLFIYNIYYMYMYIKWKNIRQKKCYMLDTCFGKWYYFTSSQYANHSIHFSSLTNHWYTQKGTLRQANRLFKKKIPKPKLLILWFWD